MDTNVLRALVIILSVCLGCLTRLYFIKIQNLSKAMEDMANTYKCKIESLCYPSYQTKPLKELYIIQNLQDNSIIWGARGGAYKTRLSAEMKLSKLPMCHRYKIVTYRIVED